MKARIAGPGAVIAIPARDEAGRIERCLAALAMQRFRSGAPVPQGSLEVLLLANNCADRTAEIGRAFAGCLPFTLSVVESTLSVASAGGARRCAMDEAAARLAPGGSGGDGVILTTDADSVVSPTWFADNMRHLQHGADCVAGYIDAEPLEIVSLGRAFLDRGRLEDSYLRQVAEIHARCDPRPHDPWPNHRVSSGASLAVKLSAYRAIGGLPPRAVGEDIAFTDLLDRHGFKVRHALDVTVVTSCRLDGRAAGGAADTMRHRRDVPDAECDDELEPALATLRRAVMRGTLRKAWQEGRLEQALRRLWPAGGIAPIEADNFNDAWDQLAAGHPDLKRGPRLRPSDLPRQIAVAGFILRQLRALVTLTGAPADKSPRARSIAPAIRTPRQRQKDRSPDSRRADSRSRRANGIE
jgi:GT2 family glycosyltransferase